ncbi:ATPase AAA [Steroidobacter denitrificans]|uniref:ATPase AAA n=1 Tax=Steroidobacter denitrificans TaxID=465721 RepID=A0A127F4Y2_STEDE|nr:ATP-binding protein [Steroidobacter denitrificans]AMN45514.1 ATPase AAA [Steroidobacter denitrificans]
MTSKGKIPFHRPQADTLARRLAEPRRFMQVVTGPRQVGKSTLVQQVTEGLDVPVRYASADEPTLRAADWISQQWEAVRLEATAPDKRGALLVLDEIQKIPAWSETVKRLWDEDTRAKRPLKVVLLGSAPLLIASGLTESLAGRFETLHLPHWPFAEMREAFGCSLDQYLFHGGYPGAAPLIGEPVRWSRYVADSLIETSIARDVLLLSRVDKPALLRRLFDLACHYSGQVLSYTKMLGQLQDAGNTTTLAHYLDLLAGAGMVRGLPKYAGDVARRRGSSPKLQVLNTALMTATSGLSLAEARADREFWGRLVESAVGAHLANAAAAGDCEVYYWRERNHEVDFVVKAGRRLTAIEVKSGRAPLAHAGSAAFAQAFKVHRTLLVGGDGVSVEDFLLRPVLHWVGP